MLSTHGGFLRRNLNQIYICAPNTTQLEVKMIIHHLIASQQHYTCLIEPV